MKNIVIINDVSNIQNPVGGPSICMKLLQNEIKSQMKYNKHINLNITNSYADVKDSLVWHWSPIYKIEFIDMLINNGNIIICGPNSFFKGGGVTEYEKYLIENKNYKYLFLHPKQYSNSTYFQQFLENITIYDIIYPVDPRCYVSSPEIDRIYDVLIYKKFGCEDTYNSVIKIFQSYNTNTVSYGSYKIEHLTYLASRSKCCIYLSCGETGGTACAEILCNGCPIISYCGNLTYGDDNENCIKLPDNGTFLYKPHVILQHYDTCSKMDNLLITNKAREKFDIEKITSNILSLLAKIASEE